MAASTGGGVHFKHISIAVERAGEGCTYDSLGNVDGNLGGVPLEVHIAIDVEVGNRAGEVHSHEYGPSNTGKI